MIQSHFHSHNYQIPKLKNSTIMASNFSYKFLSFFLFFSISSLFSYAILQNDKLPLSSAANLSKLQAEKMIKAFNLVPKHPINIPARAFSLDAYPQIVEKPLDLNALGLQPSVQDLGHHAGYYKLPHAKAARMFYFFFESRNNKDIDPVVIWLTGGPGYSGELALFYENGPYHLSKNNSLRWNDYGWDKASNLIYVDQPTGTGFSYTTDKTDIRQDENGVSNDLYDFLQAFFKQHPQFAKNDFYITGESYAGHYIPALAARVHQGNKNKEGIQINLKGFAIGNGMTNPGIQYQAYTDYALENKVIQKDDYDRINTYVPACEEGVKSCGLQGGFNCESAYGSCNAIFAELLNVIGTINYYDIRKQCEGQLCYDFSNMDIFLNDEAVKKALGIGDIDFVSCSTEVYSAMVTDWMRNYEVDIPPLLEAGIRVLIYAGEEDLVCNWIGNSRWVNAMAWSGQPAFAAAPNVPFVVEGAEAGQMKSHGPLTFLKVYAAGHMVPMDQPKAALHMLQTWMQGKLAVTTTKGEISPK